MSMIELILSFLRRFKKIMKKRRKGAEQRLQNTNVLMEVLPTETNLPPVEYEVLI